MSSVCKERPTKTAAPEEKAAAEKKAVQSAAVEKQAVKEKDAGVAMPYLAPNEVNLPVG